MESNGIKVYIGNCEGITEGEIRDEFSRFGRIENVWLARNPPGFAFCWYSDDRDASDAVRAMDGKNLCGKTLRVEISHNRPPRKDRDNDRGYDRYADRDRYSSRSSGGGYGRPPPTSRGGPPRKTGFKVRLSNMPINTHWTELKDYMRKVGDVIYTNTENGEGYLPS